MMLVRFFAYCATALMTLCLIWVLGWLWFAASVVSMKPDDDWVKTDAIIVLTGGGNRVNTGLDLLAADKAQYLFISGVNAQVKPAELIGLWKGDHAKVLPRMILGYAAADTASNAIESQEWILKNNIKTVRLVTANYHMARSMLMFHEQVPDVTIYRHPVIPDDFEPWSRGFWVLTFSEYNKMLATWLRLDLLNKNPSLNNG